jgi:hypothetical protein
MGPDLRIMPVASEYPCRPDMPEETLEPIWRAALCLTGRSVNDITADST